MNKRAREFIVKLFSLIIAITMSIPTNVFASSGTKRPKEMPTMIRLADSGEGEDTYVEDSTEDTYIEDEGEAYSEDIEQTQPAETTEVIEEAPQEEASTIAEEDASNYVLSQKARLNDNHDGIIYDIKLKKKEKSYHDPNNKLSLSLMLNPNQALKDIKLTKVAIDGKEEKREDKSNKVDDLQTLNLSTPTFEKEITYTVEASIDKKAIDTNKLYSMDLSLDIGQFNLVLQRISCKFVEYEKEDKSKELKLTHIKEAEDAIRSISYKKDDGDVDKVIYTDYIISKDKGDEESRANEKNKINYAINLENLKKEDTEISLDYYKADDKGFNMKKEFSTKVPYQEKLDLDIPASYILKLTVTSKTDKKNTKIESHKINGREVKSPRFVKEEEKSSDDDEEAAKKAEEKKAAEEKAKAEEKREAEEAKKAEAEKQAEEAKKEEEAKSADEKKEDEEKSQSEKEAKESKKETNDKLKAEKEADKKEANKKDDLLNSLKEEAPTKEEENKAKTEVKEDSNLSKADAELKAALADKTKGIEDIQNLLTSLGEKYKLTREDQAKLMTANDPAIKALVEKDRKENFRPNVLATVESKSFADKKFNLKAKISVKASNTQPIPQGHYVDVKVGPYLTKDANEPIKDLTYNGKTVATGEYIADGDNHYIRYTYVDKVTEDMDLNIDQILAFYTPNIGYVSYVDIDIKVAPKGNPVQSMPRITVRREDPSPVDSSYTIIDQGEIKSGTYPYQLNWRTTSQKLKDNKGNVIDKNLYLDKDKLQGAYVEWDIEVDTDKLIDPENPLTFENLNLTVFGSAKQGLQDFRFRASKNKDDLNETTGYTVSDNMGELLSQSTQIAKSQLGDKLYIKVKALIDPNQVHETYNIGFRINPDKNYIDNLLTEYKDKFDRLPTPIKWLKGVEDAERFAKVPFNLVETNIPATFLGLNDKFTNERFYYDNTRTIVADRKSDSRADWYALDLLRRGEGQDPALDNPTFDINNGQKDQTIKPTKVYFIPLKDGGYRRTTQAQDAILPNGQYYPGTLISYEYLNEKGVRNDTYNFRASLKEKKKYNIDESYDTEGGRVNLFTEKVSDQALLNGYLAYIESPYPVMRINKNFDMVSCFNDRINAPVYDGSKGVFLDIHEDVSGDYLLNRLNESIGNQSGTYSLKNLLQPNVQYEDGVYLNNGNKTQGQAMEELMKKIYFYGEEVKKEYSKERNNEEMHRMIEASMYQRVIHHFTDGKALSQDYFDAPSDYNVDEWKVDHTLQGNRQPYPQTGWDDSFEGSDEDRKTSQGLRKLKDNETRIRNYPPVQKTQYEMARRLYQKVIDSYKNGNDWNDDKADSVKLVFYSHTDEGKYQELIAGRVMAPIEIDKYKRSGDNIFAEKLPGAEFKFTNVATGESKTWKSPEDNNKVNKLYLRPGTYKVQEINTPQGYEKIKDFEITVKSTEINPDDGPYNAKKLPKIHVNDGFKTEVVLANNLPQTPDGKALVKIDDKNKIKVNVANIEDNLGKLEFVKRNKFIKLNGAEFRLRKINATDLNDAKTKFQTPESLTYDAKYDKTSKGSYGEFKFEQIPAGFYVLEETKVPEGYEKAPLYLLEAKETTDANNKKKVEVSFVDTNLETEKARRDGKEIDLPIIRNKTKETEIKFRKVRTENLGTDKEHLGLGDAKFRLMSLGLVDGDFYLKEGFTDHSKPTEEGETRVDGQQARGGGYITFDGLKAGEYLLEELQAPKGYNKTTIYGWKLVVSELKADDEATGKKKGDLSYKLYEVPKGKDLNRTDLKEVKLDEVINDKDKIKAFQIGNDARKISVPFKKYKGKIVEKEDGTTDIEATEDTTQLKGKNGKPVSFDLYKSDFYGAIIGEKDESGNIIPYKKNITQDANGNFNLEGLEFGGYYILRETNPPAGYDKAADITLKVEAEAIADEGKMKVIVRDPNTNAKTDLHSVFQGVIDFEEGEKLGKFSIKKVGNAIGAKDENGNPIKVGLRRAYFRLYTANDKYEIEYKDPEKKYPKEYIQKVTPGVPITKPDGNGGQTGKTPEEIEQEAPNQGIVTFDNLKPGKYVLEEYRGPAGYERDPNYWYILVEKDGTVHKYRDNPENTTNPRTAGYSTQSVRYQTFGLDKIEPIGLGTLMEAVSGLEISDENTPQSVGASGWQDVDPARSDTEKVYKNETNGRVESRILAINKDDGSKAYKQQILVTPNKKIKQFIDLARVNGTNTDDVTILSVKEVGQGSTLDKIVGTPTDIKYTRGRIQEGSSNIYKPRITTVATDKPILIEVEVPYSTGERIGLRVEYFLDGIGVGKRPSPYEKGYDNEDSINKESQTYKVSIDPNMVNGSVTADKTENLKEGDTVNLTVTPATGYKLKTLLVNGDDKTADVNNGNYQITMPASDVTVSAVFEEDKQPTPETYNINLIQNAGGRLTISPQGPYKAGDNVTVTITPDSGKKLDKLSVDGNELSVTGNTYTFKMPAKDIDVSATFTDEGTVTPQPTGDMTVRANFTYTNQTNGIDDSKTPPQGSPGTIRLEVNQKQGLVDNWVVVRSENAPYKGTIDFTNLDPDMDYRLVYERKDEIANGWGTDYETIIPIDSTKADKDNIVTVDISNGNLIEIFNKDESGFRIPLRISKVNENKAALTGSQFKARKLINGEKVRLYEKNDDGSYTDTGKDGYPKYYNEKFDGVSEATGKPGDNYFRELTPGIYELTEIKTPNDSYRLPKDKDGKDMKWYFKVVINKDKVPSDANYMDIKFDFEHTFKETDDFNSAISEEEKKDLIGKTIKGFTRGDPDFARYIEEVRDDGRSDPARPDAPYKWIHDARVTNYKNKTSLGFMKKDSETHRNISGAVFSLRKAKLDTDGNLVFENNKPAYAPEKTTGEDGKPLTEAELNLQRVQPYDKDKKFAKAVSNEKLGVEFTNIDEGTYILEEIKPADGYRPTDSFLAIKFTEGDDGAWKQEVKAYAKDKDGVYKEMPEPNDFVGRNDDGEFVSVKNDKAYTKLKFQKIEGNKDSEGNEVPVESADFRLTQVDKDGNKIPGGYEKNIYSYGGNSVFEFTNIPVGRYKLQETRAITKFEKPDPWFFNVVQDPETHKLKIVFENDPDGKLDESIGFKTKADGSPDYDADGNLQDIKIRNYSKTSFSFMKYKNETDEEGNKLPLKDAYFRLKRVRYSMDEGSKTYEYYGEDKDAVLKKYTNGKKVTEYDEDGNVTNYTYNGDVISKDDTDNYKPDFITNATGKYSSLRRSQSDGSVDFQDLGEGIYQLEEVGIPDGYQSGKDQTKWIFEVKKTDNGLKVEHNVATEKTYFENYDKAYYNDFYNDYYNKVYSANPEGKPNIEGDEKNGYNITNTKATTNLKWKKIGSRNKDNVIKKYTKFVLLKTSDNPDDIDSTDEETVKNVISGQSSYPPYLVESTEGIFEIKDLSKGIYNLIETDAPEGYKEATRKIAIKVYEDENGAIQKQFYEVENGKLIKEAKDFNTLLNRNPQNPEVDTDTDEEGNKVFYFNNESKPYHFDLSKGYMENGKFTDITKGKLKVKIYADPDDKTNTDTNVYEQTIDLSDAKSYKINLNSDIKLGKDYILEEVESPDGYAKTNYRYRLRFAYNTSWDTPFVATLVAVLKEVENKDGTKTWTPLKNSSGQNITDSGQLLAGGQSINSGFPFRIVNNKTEVEFTKVGKDEVKGTDGKLEYKYPPLKGVEFYLEKQDPDDIHKDNQGYYPLTKNMEMIKPETDDKGNTTYYYIDRDTGEKVTKVNLLQAVTPENSRGTYTSNDQGKFKITDLTDGYYRIKEPQAPKDYMQVIGAVKKFKVDQGRVYVFEQDNATGQEVAKELTDKNIESLGKIINEKPGKGKFELNKTNEKGDALDEVKFELYNSEGTKIKDYTTDANGKITFEGLPYGTYWLRETKTKDGYIVDRRIRQVRLGKDWNVPSKPSKPKDVTNSIKFDGSQRQLKSIGSQTSSFDVVYPNQQEAILAYFKFKIDEGADVKAGDTFTLTFSDNVDLYGIFVDNKGKGNTDDANFNIYSEAGLVAKAKVNDDKRSITYTFTEYLDNYNVSNMRLSLQLYADRYKVPFSQNINVTAKVGNTYTDGIYVDYRGYTPGQNHRGYQDPRVDVSSYMLRLNPDTGEFTTVVYYNPWNDTTSNSRYFEFSTSEPVDINSVKLFEKTGYGSHANGPVNGDLPDSYGIDFEDPNSYRAQGLTAKSGRFSSINDSKQNYYMYIDPNGGTKNSTYVMVIQGKLRDISTTKSLETTAYYNFPYWNYNYWENENYGYFHTWSQFYQPEGTSEGDLKELSLNLVNFKNKIEFMKVDGGVKANVVDTAQTDGTSLKDTTPGSALAGAKFKLQFKKDKNGKWTETNYGEKTSDDKGFFSWEALAPGKYQVIETETPDNSKYDLPTEPVATFTVDEHGNIVDVVPDDLILENYRKAEIKIRKTDYEGNNLAGADFTLTPKDGLKDPSTGENIPAKTETTGTDGLATFTKLVAGKYTLTEEKAPEGYKKTDREYYLEVTKDGKVLWTNSFYDSYNNMKTVKVKTYTGQDQENLRSEIVGIDRANKRFRQIVTITAKSSELEKARLILESKAKGIKLSQANTEVRVVQYEGNEIKDKDDSTYTVDINNGANPNLTIRINPPYRNKEENKSVGSDESTSPKENDGDIVRTYKVIVDMPYGEDEIAGAKISYDIGKISETTGKVEFTENDEVKEVDKYAEKGNYSVSLNDSSPLNYRAQYLPRDINLLTTDIANIKQPDIYLKKVDADDKTALAGAEFELQKKVGDVYKSIDKKGNVIASPTDNTPKWTATSDGQGNFEFKSIPDGEYRIFETKAPTGYVLSDKTVYKFKVNKGKIYKVDKETGVAERNELIVGTDKNSETNRIEITNKKAQYPYTGGPGVWIGFTILGVLTMTAAGIYLAQKKKYQTK
ncbi:SpaA isopeptide-forming pilin-related protein [Anaerococcus marasmi]|uniref:SpaA isopeptide-forming pilin-related protein n=1 Tax=Anaerococcus marasmi TaxID=2057797 RepID=UPI000CF865E7|nr:SpaA isopeptide-forming pilin-related protein [Anaerococcus marasmi]